MIISLLDTEIFDIFYFHEEHKILYLLNSIEIPLLL